MWRLIVANALAHRSRLALTWLAVALGVAFVTGSLVLTDTSSRVLDKQFRTASAGVDLTVRTAAAFDSAMGVEVQRAPLPAALLRRVTDTPGVERSQPTAYGDGQLQIGGRTVMPAGPTILHSWAEAPFTAYRLREGHAPHGAGEVVLDAATAHARGVRLGDTVTVSATASQQLQVVGLAGVGGQDGLPNSSVVLVDLPTAQTLLGLGSGVSSIDVIARSDEPVVDLRNRLAGSLGSRYAVTTAQDTAAASADAAKQSISYLRIVLLALAGAGLLVGAFLIANTFAIVLSQRSKELALLRAAGATGRQVFASVLGEALLLGITGALGGTAAGIGTAYALRDLAGAAGLALPDGPLTVAPRTLLVALAAGTVITLLAAVLPARRAARIAPVEAMRLSDPASTTIRRRRLVSGWVVLALGAIQLIAAATIHDVVGVAIGAVLFLVGLFLLGPALTPRLAQAVGRPLARLGVPGRLAGESAARNPRRTTATAMALALGLALISFMSVLDSSVRAGVGASYREAIIADLVIESSRNEMLGGLSPEVARQAAGVPEVALTSRIRFGHWLDHGSTNVLTAVDPATVPQAVRMRLTAGSLPALDTGGVVISDDVARTRHLHVGDSIAMTFPRDGEQRLRIVGVMDAASTRALSSSYVVSLATYAVHYSENLDASVLVVLAHGARPGQARTALAKAIAAFPNAQIRDQAQAAANRTAAIDQVFGMISVLLCFAVLLALLGITNTLALSIVERTREIGLLRAVGMTRRQLRSMIRAEAALIAAVAAVVGIGVGLGLAAATLGGLSSHLPLVVRIPAGQLLAVLATTVLAGLAAGLLPARRAARLDVLGAIATQ